MFVLAIYNCAKATLTSKEVWRYGNSRSPEPAKGPALSLASAALPAVVPWQLWARQSHPGPSPFTLVARLVGSLRVLPEPADLGQLFKITYWHRKRGNRRKRGLPIRCMGDST